MPHVSSDIARKLRRRLQIVTIFCTFYVAVEWIVTLCVITKQKLTVVYCLIECEFNTFFFSFWVRAGRSHPLVYITVTIVKIVTRNKLNVPEFNCPWPILLFPCGMCGRCKSLNYVEFHVRLQNIRILNCVFLILRLHYHTCCWKE